MRAKKVFEVRIVVYRTEKSGPRIKVYMKPNYTSHLKWVERWDLRKELEELVDFFTGEIYSAE